MKNILYIITIIICFSCSSNKSNEPKKVIITGKIQNINPNRLDVKLYVNRLGLPQLEVFTKSDSLGNFKVTFETYIATDVWIDYKSNILILVHPGDSLHVEFSGKPNKRPAILKTIKFSGDAADVNRQAAVFQEMYFSNPLFTDNKTIEYVNKNYEIPQYSLYLDTLQKEYQKLFDTFVSKNTTSSEGRIWAYTYMQQAYIDEVLFYPMKHKNLNKLSPDEFIVPLEYYSPIFEMLPIDEASFISANALSSYSNRFLYNYVGERMLQNPLAKKYEESGYENAPNGLMDSLMIYSIVEFTQDGLLRQILLTEWFMDYFDENRIIPFENHLSLIESSIKENYLKEPLYEKYKEVKKRSDNPTLAYDAMVKNVEGSSIEIIIDSILQINKGQVIYIDCWATWCSPCKKEMPNSKKLMNELAKEDVAFVFLCIDSKKKLWKTNLSELQIGGQHYFLDRTQSTELREIFEISGIPHYILIDREGTIIEKGSALRPNRVKGKIIKLLIKNEL